MTANPASATRDGLALRFPGDFLWGAATSSHQVEGNNVSNDWWEYEQAGRLPHRSGEACRHYELFEQDFDLCQALGHNAHRFSIEWSRVEPTEGRWNDDAIQHYRAVVDALRRRGIEPMVTLHHFSNPAWFVRHGGWLHADSVSLFARYVRRMSAELEGVRYWLTINEPTVYAKQAFVLGHWPPCLRGGWPRAARVLWNQARAHRAAYRLLRGHDATARVGFAHSAPWIAPCDPDRGRDRLAARARDFLLNDAFLYLIGARPRRHPRPARGLDFLGINYYTRTIVRAASRGRAILVGEECFDQHHADRGPLSDTGWEAYARGLVAVLRKFATLRCPLIVTENGVATLDEAFRTTFLHQHLAALGQALGAGVDVRGYLYWSLMDNFEWTLGFTPRFGLAAVDFRTQARVARPAAEAFARVCRSNQLDHPIAPL